LPCRDASVTSGSTEAIFSTSAKTATDAGYR